jgi:peptide/nickel transport system ATP-binding protein
MAPILEIRDLSVGYASRRAVGLAVCDLSLNIEKGEIIGLGGESGCGKTTLAVALLNLIEPPGVIQSGSAYLQRPDGKAIDLLHIPRPLLRQIRWKEIAYIPQGSMSALNPVLRVKQQMTDTLVQHGLSKAEALERARWAISLVSLDASVLEKYPHELSGGMNQRVAIANAITMQPAVLIADEPTTALDVVTQRSILQELVKIRDQFGTTIILISHDMGVMAQVVDRMAVMYAGRIAEFGPVIQIFEESLHPYTQKLIGSIPRSTGQHLEGLAGEAPSLWKYPPGCRFHPRCSQAFSRCKEETPALREIYPGQYAACHLYEKQQVTA